MARVGANSGCLTRARGRGVEPKEWRLHSQVLGLARLTHRGATFDQGGLTMWPREGQVLRNELGNPADGVLLRVSEVPELQEPIIVLLRGAFGSDSNRRARD